VTRRTIAHKEAEKGVYFGPMKPGRKKEPPREWMGKAEYARHRGVSKAYISKLLRQGKIQAISGMIDAVEADKALDARKQLAPEVGTGGLSESSSLTEAQKRWTDLRAEAAAFKLECDRGLWIRKDKAESDAFYCYRITRDTLLNIPNRIAPIVAAESDGDKVRMLLLEEIERTLNDLCDNLKRHGLEDKQ